MPETIKNTNFKITISTAIVVLIFTIGTTIKVVNSSNTQTQKLEKHLIQAEYIQDRVNKNDELIKEIQEACRQNDLRFVEIKTKLAGIETILEDIRDRK